MNILVIKQTSLGDVLHSTGHLRTIKQNFPDSHLTLLTSPGALDIYRHNPWVDEILLFESYRIKREWRKHPLRCLRYIRTTITAIRKRHYALAFDLQGLGKSVLFLYAARAEQKYVKGNWRTFGIGTPLHRFRNRNLHAIAEMDGVLRTANLRIRDTTMEIITAPSARRTIDKLCARINPQQKPLLLISPFTRWRAKNWHLHHYLQLAARAAEQLDLVVAITAADKTARAQITAGLSALPTSPPPPNAAAKAANTAKPQTQIHNLAARLSLMQLGELTERAALVITGDSFPMHLACAKNTPVIALFAPTDERKTGPRPTPPTNKKTKKPAPHIVIRPPNCRRCDRPNCPRHCLANLPPEKVWRALQTHFRAN